MREFYVFEENQPMRGPMELEEAIESITFYVGDSDRKYAVQKYVLGQECEFYFSYEFNSATVTVWPKKYV